MCWKRIPVEFWIFIFTLYRNKHIYGLFIACRKKACSSCPAPPIICWSSYLAEPNHKMSVYIRQMFTSNRKSVSGLKLYCVCRLYWADFTWRAMLCVTVSTSRNKEQVPTSSYGSPLLSFHSNVFYRCLHMNFRLNSLCFLPIRKYDMLSVWYLVIKFWLKSS